MVTHSLNGAPEVGEDGKSIDDENELGDGVGDDRASIENLKICLHYFFSNFSELLLSILLFRPGIWEGRRDR